VISKKFQHILYCLFIACSPFKIQSQHQLLLLRKDQVMYRISEGYNIRLQQRNKDFVSGTIEGIHRDFIILVNKDTIFIKNIRKIYVRRLPNPGLRVADVGTKLIMGGCILAGADYFNSDPKQLSSGTLAISGSFIGAGILFQFINNNYFKVGFQRRVIPKI
jgi:hypothetical protein